MIRGRQLKHRKTKVRIEAPVLYTGDYTQYMNIRHSHLAECKDTRVSEGKDASKQTTTFKYN